VRDVCRNGIHDARVIECVVAPAAVVNSYVHNVIKRNAIAQRPLLGPVDSRAGVLGQFLDPGENHRIHVLLLDAAIDERTPDVNDKHKADQEEREDPKEPEQRCRTLVAVRIQCSLRPCSGPPSTSKPTRRSLHPVHRHHW